MVTDSDGGPVSEATPPEHPHGYERWSAEADRRLVEAAHAGDLPEALAVEFGRSVGAVQRRLSKLYLLAGLRARGADEDTITAWVGRGPAAVPVELQEWWNR